jgi:hypothetical protein
MIDSGESDKEIAYNGIWGPFLYRDLDRKLKKSASHELIIVNFISSKPKS